MLRSLFTVSEHLWFRVRGEIHTRMKSERGAVSAEYAILVVFIALVIIVGATALGIAINAKLNDAAGTLNGAGGGGGGGEGG